MARPRKIQQRRDRPNYWYTWILEDGKRVRKFLGKTEKEAVNNFKRFEVAALETEEGRKRKFTVARAGIVTLDDLASAHLEWIERHEKPATLAYHTNVIGNFVKWAGRSTLAEEIIPLHIEEWIADNATKWSGTTRKHYITTVQAMFARGMKLSIIKINPLAYVDKPANDTEQFVLSRKAEARCRAELEKEDGYFREVFLAMLVTGARPQEIRAVTSNEVRSEKGVWLWYWKAGHAPKGDKPRTIWTRDIAEQLTRERFRTPGHIFRMKRGEPWTANALRIKFMRFREKVGMPDLVAKTCRHTFCTRLQQKKVDPSHIQVFMGWTTLAMLSTYGHLDRFHLDVGLEFKRIDFD